MVGVGGERLAGAATESGRFHHAFFMLEVFRHYLECFTERFERMRPE
jgi:hypothetical protein